MLLPVGPISHGSDVELVASILMPLKEASVLIACASKHVELAGVLVDVT